MNRRAFLRATAGTAVAAIPLFGACYTFAESTYLKIDRITLTLPRLPQAFRGTTLAFVSDIHHGPFVSRDYLNAVVRTTLLLEPDLIVLGGDYSHRDAKYIAPGFECLARLTAPLGVYGVMGNHDYWNSIESTRTAMAKAGIRELTNQGVWLEYGNARLRLAGIDDLWYGRPDVAAAIGEARATDACILVSHNPDVAETLVDRRVGLVLSGHTHGGQVVIPGFGSPVVPSRYGMKYAHGLVQAPTSQVYITSGVGMTGLPVRANCRPEVSLITLI